HLYPVWLKFRGGKGVATLLGVIAPLLPMAAIVYALLWVGMLLVWRISSVAGMVAVASAPITAAVMGEWALLPMLMGFAVLVIWKHRENLSRLKNGTEPHIGRGEG
ncbi:MAG: glycerol-3-phosphate acyltransferase, partial [Hyphomicrobium sp.]|nr:glycerol-3-phosphate acyltransferase [Hyphomicrobium sp.]